MGEPKKGQNPFDVGPNDISVVQSFQPWVPKVSFAFYFNAFRIKGFPRVQQHAFGQGLLLSGKSLGSHMDQGKNDTEKAQASYR